MLRVGEDRGRNLAAPLLIETIKAPPRDRTQLAVGFTLPPGRTAPHRGRALLPHDRESLPRPRDHEHGRGHGRELPLPPQEPRWNPKKTPRIMVSINNGAARFHPRGRAERHEPNCQFGSKRSSSPGPRGRRFRDENSETGWWDRRGTGPVLFVVGSSAPELAGWSQGSGPLGARWNLALILGCLLFSGAPYSCPEFLLEKRDLGTRGKGLWDPGRS